MIATPRRRRSGARGNAEGGFTLIEVLISVVLLTMITGALSAAFVTSMKLSASTAQHTKESNDTQLVASFLMRDAQAAGATDPIGGSFNPSDYGVSLTDAAGCTVAGGTLVVRFKWLDRGSAGKANNHDDVATYSYVPPASSAESGQLVRRICPGGGGSPSDITLAKNLRSQPTATCAPSCPGLPLTVSVSVSEKQTPTPYTLTASTRPDGTAAGANDTPAPLVLLGGGNCSGAAPLSGGSNAPLKVYGTAFVEGGDSGCTAYNLGSYTATGGTEAIAPARCPGGAPGCTNITGITRRDPYEGLTAPSAGPSRSGCSGPGSYGTFALAAGQTCTLASGIYVVQNGFSVAGGATLNADGVLIYLLGGQFSISGKLNASAITTGDNAGMVLWQAAADSNPLTIAAGPGVNVHLNGAVYAPGATVDVGRRVAMKSLVAQGLSFGSAAGAAGSQIGLITPVETSMSPNILDQGMTNQTITINGGSFQNGPPAVTFGAGITVNNVNFVTANQITVDISIADDAPLGPHDVTITNPDEGFDIEEGAFIVEPRPVITSVTLANGAGTAGTIDAGDTITVVFSKPMSVSSFCPGWSNDAQNQSLFFPGDVTVIANDGGVNADTISVNSAFGCGPTGFQLGSIALGSNNYVTGGGAALFGSAAGASTISWTAATNTLVITLGAQTAGTPELPVPQSTVTYTASPVIIDTRGGTVINSPFTPAGGPNQQF